VELSEASGVKRRHSAQQPFSGVSMSMRKFMSVFVLLLLLTELVSARVAAMHGYKEMSEQADLIAIATPTENSDLPGTTTVPNLVSTSKDGKQHAIPATRVQTTFKPTAILKGKLSNKSASIELIHLKLVDPADGKGRGAAQLIEFKPADRAQYLMFLKGNNDGIYEAFSGQVDPIDSIEKLQQRAQSGE
jgi:hypothetical protein